MEEGDEIGWTTMIGMLSVAMLSLLICLISLSRFVHIGPDIGDIFVFERSAAARDWPLSTVVAKRGPVINAPMTGKVRECVLNPSVMAMSGGSLVIEAKETTEPPLFRVHWSGSRTELDSRDCGTSVDLTIPLASLRLLANSAGGFGFGVRHGLF